MNMSEHIRLSLLEEELRPTIRAIDETDDRFDFTRTKGPNPKLWIDMTSYVTMGNDQRTYRFQKDSSMGLIVLAETSDVKKTASIISEYVSEQVSERDKMMREEWSSFNQLDDDSAQEDSETIIKFPESQSTDGLSNGGFPIDQEILVESEKQEEPEATLELEVPEASEEPAPMVEEQSQTETEPEKRSVLAGLIWFLFGLLMFLLIIAAALFLGAPDAY